MSEINEQRARKTNAPATGANVAEKAKYAESSSERLYALNALLGLLSHAQDEADNKRLKRKLTDAIAIVEDLIAEDGEV